MSLRRMNEAGVLGRFVPEFGRVVGMMQFNMYHHYTVDEHLMRTVGMLTDIERGGVGNELPLSTEIIGSHQEPARAVRRARSCTTSARAAPRITRSSARASRAKLCPRFGLTPAETETVVWLIEQHLTMSNIAQSRDLSDPKTIRDFADVVQSPERLKLLLLLTVADIRAVGPGVWNGWKGQLLRTLYLRDRAAGRRRPHAGEAQPAHRRGAGGAAPRRSPIGRAAEVERFIDRHYPDYWLRTDTRAAGRARQAVAPRRERRAASSPPTRAPMPSRPSPS